MRIENLIKTIFGELQNSPKISYIDQLKLNPKQIKRADAYLCDNNQTIQNAIENGAYAIIYSGDLKITDKEIAWIKVDNIENAIIRYLRYKILQQPLKMYYCDDILFQVLKTSILDNSVIFLDGNIIKNFDKLLKMNNEVIYISNNKKFLQSINPSSKAISKAKKNHIKLIKFSIFESDIIIDNIYYKNIKIAKIFLNYLNDSIEFFNNNFLRFSIYNIFIKKHFQPIFIDKDFKILDFGTSNQVLIVESDKILFDKEIQYLKKYASYAKTAIFIPQNINININNAIKYKNFDDIYNFNNKNYNFFLILKKEKDDIFSSLNKFENFENKTLF